MSAGLTTSAGCLAGRNKNSGRWTFLSPTLARKYRRFTSRPWRSPWKVGRQLARRKITVNAISSGWIEGSVLNTLPEAAQNLIRSWHRGGWTPMGRLGTPADIGNAVALLCSQEADWITGQLIAVDGGAGLMDAALPLAIQQAVPQSAATQ